LAILGRIAAVGTIASTLPRLELLETGIASAHEYKLWTKMESFLAKHEQRNRIIVRQVFKDLRSHSNSNILLPVTRVSHNHDLVKMINTQAEWCNRNKGEHWPSPLAIAYRGGSDTTKVLNLVNKGLGRVVVATYSMIKYGLDVPRWTHVYVGIIPTSNAPNTYQALNRVCTPYDADTIKLLGPKPQPIVRFIIDEMSASVYCFAKIYNDSAYGLKGALSGSNYFNIQLAKANPDVEKRMHDIATYPKSYSAADSGVAVSTGKTGSGRARRKSAWAPMPMGVTEL
jgi:hypothetical protein